MMELVDQTKEDAKDEIKDSGINKQCNPGSANIFKEYQRKNPHLEPRVNEKQFNCNECDFQGTREIELNKHINIKHRVHGGNTTGMIVCRNCGEQFTTKWNLMYHRKEVHSSTVGFCRNNLQGRCIYTEKMCWWSHVEKVEEIDLTIRCFMCNKTFETRSEMMVHRRKEHYQIIRSCINFQSRNCRFTSESCWFKHELEKESDISKEAAKDDKMETESVFQKEAENLETPSSGKPRENI